MPAQAHWIDEPHIIGVYYSGHVSVEDIRNVIGVCIQALAQGPVHFLVDFSEIESLEPQIMELSSFSEWLYHPNARWFAYVRVTGLYKNLLQVRHHTTMKFFQERADAESFLRETVQIFPNK